MTYMTYIINKTIGINTMIVSVDEMKNYLRVDYSDDDALIEKMIESSEKLCEDIARLSFDEINDLKTIKIAVMYSVAFMYEHRENADYHALTISLRSLLEGDRKSVF